MATHEIRIDRRLPLAAEPHTGHNRWHPDIPPVLRCEPGDEVVLDTRDTFDGGFDRNSTAKDVEQANFGLVHPLTGPVPVDGAEGLRTIPPREHGGNVDIKQLTAGTRLLLPVWTGGALFSAGDAHFAQGDGESCGTAIEMAATLQVRLDLRKGQAAERGIRTLCFERDDPGPSEFSPPRPYFATTGMCVGRDGRNEFEDVPLPARNALAAMIDHLGHEYGYSRQQAYAICSVAVDLKISQVVDVPNVIVSAFLPLDILT